MIDEKLLSMLRCPIDGGKLANADTDLIDHLNQQIQSGELRDRQDQKVAESLDGGLVTEDKSRVYPIRNGIPTMIGEQAIELQ